MMTRRMIAPTTMRAMAQMGKPSSSGAGVGTVGGGVTSSSKAACTAEVK